MGVIKRSKLVYIAPDENVTELLENGELQQPDDVETVRNTDTIIHRPLPPILPQRRPLVTTRTPRRVLTHNSNEERYPKGHKKRRRYENNKYLLSLSNLEEESSPPVYETRSAFQLLFQEQDKMAAWNSFLSFNDDDQLAILENNQIYAYFSDEPILEESTVVISKKQLSTKIPLNPECTFESMCPKLKSIFGKRHFPMGTLTELENEVCEFFHSHPQGLYIMEMECSFDRLILHAICHYNMLSSRSFTNSDSRRETHIRNLQGEFHPPTVCLADFIQQRRS